MKKNEVDATIWYPWHIRIISHIPWQLFEIKEKRGRREKNMHEYKLDRCYDRTSERKHVL